MKTIILITSESVCLTLFVALFSYFPVSILTATLFLSSFFPFFLFFFPSFSLHVEPSIEVAEYLKAAFINKVIVGHQPRGDAPLVIDLGTGIQVSI